MTTPDALRVIEEAARAYDDAAKALACDREHLDTLPDTVRRRLKAAGKALNAVIKTNAMALRAAVEANQRLVELIVDAVNAQHASRQGYGGQPPQGARARPLAFDTRL